MAAAFRAASASTNGTAATTVVATVPAGVVNGDVMLMALTAYGAGGTTTVTTPTGWVLLDSRTTNNGTGCLYWRVASSEPASYTITLSASVLAAVTITAVSGASNTQPTATYFTGQANASSTSDPAPALGTFPASSGVSVGLFGYAESLSAASTFTPPSGYTEAAEAEK